jgi:exopolysaccharide biosynthesis polyprenyl glycosylphosphotransferase
MTISRPGEPSVTGPSGGPERPPAPTGGGRRWARRYSRALLAVDAVVVALTVLLAGAVRFGVDAEEALAGAPALTYQVLSVLLWAVWLGLLALRGCYDDKVVGVGPEEYKRVLWTSVLLLAGIAVVAYLSRVDIARGWVAVAIPVGTAGLVLGRYVARRRLHAARGRGQHLRTVLAVGDPAHVRQLDETLRREVYAGYRVVAACVPVGADADDVPVPVAGDLEHVGEAVRATGADTVAVASPSGTAPDYLRRLSWALEGTGVDLVVAPSLTDVAGPRIHVRPLAGLPLLHVDEPELSGARRVGKSLLDVLGSLLGILVASPVLAVAALSITFEDGGPVLYRQTRVGEGGRLFTMLKLRTMVVGAEEHVGSLEELNESDGALFKIRADPRVTRTGRFLRRWSLDELPQLVNVLRRDMSLVGPRPPLPREVARYSEAAQRRLLVRPGMTGLWQISGRADLSWDDSIRLDLWYVENWSFSQDLVILAKTARAVLGRRGAY